MSTIQSIIQPIIKPVISSVIGDDGFTPALLPNRAVWLNAKRLPISTTLISSAFNDNNLGVGNATQAVGLRQPLYVADGINGRPAMRGWHDGANNSQLAIADSAGLDHTQLNIFIVAKRNNDSGGDQQIINKDQGVDQREYRCSINASGQIAGRHSSAGTLASLVGATGTSTINVNTPFILGFRYSGTTLSLSLNGVVQASSSLASVFNGASPISLFSAGGFFQGFRGDIGEILVFNSALTTNERTALMNYLSREWGIAI